MPSAQPPCVYAFGILLCALLCALGWILSAIGQLNVIAYAVAFALLLVAGWWYLRRPTLMVRRPARAIRLRRLRRRFRRPLPLLFLLLAALSLLAGAIYPPNNVDAIAYRIPRILHWAAEGHWHWIDTNYTRMNYSATGMEWLMVPLLLFTRTDRLFFLINLVSFLMLPGLTYLVFRHLAVARRVAWNWMWLLPAGYCFVLQAASTANDTFAAVYLLAAIHFAFRARDTRRIRDLWLSILAAALLTAAKASNIPLLLPWLIAVLPSLGLLLPQRTASHPPLPRYRLLATLSILLLAALASHLPLALLNQYHSNHWTGDPTNAGRMRLSNPVSGLIGNGLMLTAQNLTPPVFPHARQGTAWLPRLLPAWLSQRLARDFPRFTLILCEIPVEESAGIGLGLGLLLLGSLLGPILAIGSRPATVHAPTPGMSCRLIPAATFVALLCYMANMGSEAVARLVAPYYPLLLPLILRLPHQPRLVGSKAWRRTATLIAAIAVPVLVAAPTRPLWPAQATLARLETRFPTSRLLHRAAAVYAGYAIKADPLAQLCQAIPENVRTIGFLGSGTQPEGPLWRPFGSRRVIHIPNHSHPSQLHADGIQFVVLSQSGLKCKGYPSIDAWLGSLGGQLVAQYRIVTEISSGPEDWFVVRTAPASVTLIPENPKSPPPASSDSLHSTHDPREP